MEIEKMWVYDVEVFPNYFCAVFKKADTGEMKHYEICKSIDQRKEMIEFLFSGIILIGYNNSNYDDRIITYILNNANKKGKNLITGLKRLSNGIVENWNLWARSLQRIWSMDLMKIHHFDNVAKMTSLKALEVFMHMDSVQDLPYEHDKVLNRDEQLNVLSYCYNDVDATHQFFEESIDKIKFRYRMSKLYSTFLFNANDVKIGELVLLKALTEGMGISEKELKKMRTHRSEMKMNEIILPYVSFQNEEFNALLDWWRKKVIYQTKGQFSELDLDDVAPIFKYTNQKLKKKKLEKLNIVYKGFQFDFGTGGIHGAIGPGVWEECEKKQLVLVDVSSYYPNLAEKNKFHPAHIPVDIFVNVIAKLYGQRMKAKAEGDDEVVKAIKLALNGALYGKSNSPFSFMFDPMFMMKICVNGQLLLVSLAEKLMDEGMELVQINTDGILVYFDRDKFDVLKKHCDEWMELTKLKLDYDHFQKVVQLNVNNYSAKFIDGSIKRKGGSFQYKLDFHKNPSALIIQKAVDKFFYEDIRVEDFINNHSDIRDFVIRAKVKRAHKLIMRTEEGDVEVQRTGRYLVTNNGGTLIKVMPPLKGKTENRETNLEAGYLTTLVNDSLPYLPDGKDYITKTFCPETGEDRIMIKPEFYELKNKVDINYQYYIDGAYRIIDQIVKNE